MRTNDIVDVFVAYSESHGAKSRPILKIKLIMNKLGYKNHFKIH